MQKLNQTCVDHFKANAVSLFVSDCTFVGAAHRRPLPLPLKTKQIYTERTGTAPFIPNHAVITQSRTQKLVHFHTQAYQDTWKKNGEQK